MAPLPLLQDGTPLPNYWYDRGLCMMVRDRKIYISYNGKGQKKKQDIPVWLYFIFETVNNGFYRKPQILVFSI